MHVKSPPVRACCPRLWRRLADSPAPVAGGARGAVLTHHMQLRVQADANLKGGQAGGQAGRGVRVQGAAASGRSLPRLDGLSADAGLGTPGRARQMSQPTQRVCCTAANIRLVSSTRDAPDRAMDAEPRPARPAWSSSAQRPSAPGWSTWAWLHSHDTVRRSHDDAGKADVCSRAKRPRVGYAVCRAGRAAQQARVLGLPPTPTPLPPPAHQVVAGLLEGGAPVHGAH